MSPLTVISCYSLLHITPPSPLCLKPVPFGPADSMQTEPWVSAAWRDWPARRLWVTADVISIGRWGHTWGQTLLSPLRQPLNSRFQSAALDDLSPHWSWQYECGHGAKWYCREWDCTPSLVLLHTRLPAAPVSMGLFQLQDMSFEDPFDVAQFFWHRYKYAKSCTVGVNLEL